MPKFNIQTKVKGETAIQIVDGRMVNFKEFPNFKFFISDTFDVSEFCVYEYKSGAFVGKGFTQPLAKQNAIERINKFGGESKLPNSIKLFPVINGEVDGQV